MSRTQIISRVLLGIAMLLVNGGPLFAQEMVVTSCGTTVPDGSVGVLGNDLDCSAAAGHCADDPSITCTNGITDCPGSSCIRYGVHLAPSATLRMNGFSITGGDYGVLCRDYGCTVDGGGGTIANQEFSAVWLFGGGKLKVSNLTIHDTLRSAIAVAYFARRVFLENVVSYNNVGIVTTVDVVAKNVTLSGSPPGGCGFGGSLQGGSVWATDVTANYVSASRLKASNLVVDALCGEGIRVDGKAVLKHSSVTGAQQVDILTGKHPHLRDTTCGTSAQLLPDGTAGATWGVCAND